MALGTVVAADGLILTKASQLADKPECRLADGRKLPAKVVGTDEATDLALLRVRRQEPHARRLDRSPAPGSIVAATAPGGEPLAIGAISDVSQAMPGPTPTTASTAGWGSASRPSTTARRYRRFARQRRRESRTAKRRSHQAAGRAEIRTSDDLIGKLREMPPNREVSLTVGRKDKDMELKVTLSPRRAVWSRTIGAAAPSATAAGGCQGDTERPRHLADRLRRAARRSGRPLRRPEHRPRTRVASYALPASVVKETVEKLRQRPVTSKSGAGGTHRARATPPDHGAANREASPTVKLVPPATPSLICTEAAQQPVFGCLAQVPRPPFLRQMPRVKTAAASSASVPGSGTGASPLAATAADCAAGRTVPN